MTNEMHMLALMDSPFVLGLDYSFHDQEKAYIVFKMLTGGDLRFHQKMVDANRFETRRARFYAAEVLLGLQSLHSKGIVYRDLKPANVLLDGDGHAVISDLGLATKLHPQKKLRERAGTAGYWAPEIVSKSGTYYTSDYWSFGIMLYYMLVGKRPNCTCDRRLSEWCPFSASKSEEILAKGNSGTLKLSISYPHDVIDLDAQDLLERSPP